MLSISLRWRPLPQKVGEGESLDGGPEHRRVEVEHLDDPGVLLGVVGGQQLGRHLEGVFTIDLNPTRDDITIITISKCHKIWRPI